MRRLREWIHGRGRNIVITVVIVLAFSIVAHYFVVERHGKWGLESPYSADVQETVSPKPQEDYYIGGSSIGKVEKGTTITTGDTISDNSDKNNDKK